MSIEDRFTDKKRTLVSRMLFKKLDLEFEKIVTNIEDSFSTGR